MSVHFIGRHQQPICGVPDIYRLLGSTDMREFVTCKKCRNILKKNSGNKIVRQKRKLYWERKLRQICNYCNETTKTVEAIA